MKRDNKIIKSAFERTVLQKIGKSTYKPKMKDERKKFNGIAKKSLKELIITDYVLM